MDENENQLINSNNECRWFKGSPLALCCTGLYKSSASGNLFAKIKFMNVQPEQIRAVTLDIICYGIIRNEVGRIEDYAIDNLEINRNECFADSEIICIENNDTMAIDILLKDVTAQDGEVWTNDEGLMFTIPLKQNSISSHMGRYFEKLRTEWSEKGLEGERLLYAPCIKDDYWICACGTLNWSVEESCCECGANLDWLDEVTNVSLLRSNEEIFKKQSAKFEKSTSISSENADKLYQQRHQKDLDYERKNALKHKNKKKIKLITGFTAILFVLAALTLGIYFILIPANNYYNATSLIDEGKYDQAIEALENLDGYGDSAEQIKRAKYLKAENLQKSGNYIGASEIFSKLDDYSDSKQKYNEAMYQYGEQQFTAKKYISSLKIFTNLGDYEDSALKAGKSEKAAFDAASKLLEEKKYSEASDAFLQIADITQNTKAIEQSNLSLHKQADKLYNNYKYVEAIKIYQSISGYDHVDVTLNKLDNLTKILSTSIHIGDDSSVWESVEMPCSYCHSPNTLGYHFYFKANGTYEFDKYCPNHSGKTINKILQGQYKIEDNKIYTLEHIGGDTKWSELATIENITSDSSTANKNAKMVITNPFLTKSKGTLTLYGNIVDQNSSPI